MKKGEWKKEKHYAIQVSQAGRQLHSVVPHITTPIYTPHL